jgi:hypothetical protein
MKRRRQTAAQRRNGPATVERRNWGLPGATPVFNSPFAAALAPIAAQPPDYTRRHDGPRIRTANFDAILTSNPQSIVAARVTGKGWRNERS